MDKNTSKDLPIFDKKTAAEILLLPKNERKLVFDILKEKELFKTMTQKQLTNRWYNSCFSKRDERIKILFSKIQKICQTLELPINTFCLALQIFDAILSKFPLEDEVMLPVSIVCLVISIKIEENQNSQITYDSVNSYIYNYGLDFYLEIEQVVLEQLDFSLHLITPNHFLNFLLNKFLENKNLFFGIPNLNFDLEQNFIKIIFNLHLIVLVEFEFYQFTSLAVAIGIIIFGRVLAGLTLWPEELETFTGVNAEDVQPVLKLLYDRYTTDYLRRTFRGIDFFVSEDDIETDDNENKDNSELNEEEDTELNQNENELSIENDLIEEMCTNYFLSEYHRSTFISLMQNK